MGQSKSLSTFGSFLSGVRGRGRRTKGLMTVIMFVNNSIAARLRGKHSFICNPREVYNLRCVWKVGLWENCVLIRVCGAKMPGPLRWLWWTDRRRCRHKPNPGLGLGFRGRLCEDTSKTHVFVCRSVCLFICYSSDLPALYSALSTAIVILTLC